MTEVLVYRPKNIDNVEGVGAWEHELLPAIRRQYGGTHYKTTHIQPWEYIEANNLDFWEGNVIKYVTRWKEKDGVQDLIKARHYLEYMIERELQKYGKLPKVPKADENSSGTGPIVPIITTS